MTIGGCISLTHHRRPAGDRMIRAAIVVAGVSAAVAGVAVAAHQMTLWLLCGYLPPIQFSTLWFALGGTVPALLRSYGVSGFMTTLLDLPLCEVLFLGGVCTAWIASERTNHAQIAL
jgi:hypothetical protein